MNYLHLRSKLFNNPLAILPEKLREIHRVVDSRLNLNVEIPIGAASVPIPTAAPPGSNTVAGRAPLALFVIPVFGTLVNRGLNVDAMSGLTSYEYLGALLNAAVSDPRASSIILDIDSFGGEVAGCFDLARSIRAADATKPVYALVNANACSAAYAIASAARQIIAVEESIVGSIGVIATHVDESGHNDKEGFAITHITFGKRKADFAPDAALSPPARKWLQNSVNESGSRFVQLVAQHRNLSEDAVAETQAAIFSSAEALEAGLIDAVMPANEALSFILSEVETMDTNNGNTQNPAGASANAQNPTGTNPGSTPTNPAPGNNKPGTDDGNNNTGTGAPASQPTQPAQPSQGANVVDLAAVRNAASQDAAAIMEACAAVGRADLAAGMVRRGLSLQSAQSELFTVLHGNTAQPIDTTNSNPAGTNDDAAAGSLLAEAMKGVNAAAFGKPVSRTR
jgi:signal peptide peptidase SppA